MKKVLLTCVAGMLSFLGAKAQLQDSVRLQEQGQFQNMEFTPAFHGKGDVKVQVGANLQKHGTGIIVSANYGMGESFSFGIQSGYILGYRELQGVNDPSIFDRFELSTRASAHLGGVIGLPTNVDVYPGLNLSLKNFGAHIGGRYFFSKGFGLYSEIAFPLARYKTSAADYQLLNNRFSFSIGASFDLKN